MSIVLVTRLSFLVGGSSSFLCSLRARDLFKVCLTGVTMKQGVEKELLTPGTPGRTSWHPVEQVATAGSG